MPKLPSRIYRYQRIEPATLESLCHDLLYFASPATFNDPLDCSPSVEADSDNLTLRNILTELVRKRVSHEMTDAMTVAKFKLGPNAEAHIRRVSTEETSRSLQEIAYHATNPDHDVSEEEAERRLLTREIERELLQQYDSGVCCFSSTYDNPLLWSHYGGQHRGLCVGYSMNRRPVPVLQKVLYGGSRLLRTNTIAQAVLQDDPDAAAKVVEAMLLRKATPWRYEREWRIVGKVGLQDSCLKLLEITFGLRCPDVLMHMLIRSLDGRSSEVAFHKMHEVRDRFELKRHKVDVDELQAYFPKTAGSGEEMFGSSTMEVPGPANA